MRKRTLKSCIGLALCLALLAGGFPAPTARAEGEKETYLAQLAAAGFPASYQESLWTLHQQYPNWTFQVMTPSVTWAQALAAESALGVSLVPGSAASSWKSTQAGAYNWTTSTWVMLDSGGWVAASAGIVAYYLDPRNFLGGDAVFQFLHQGFDGAAQTAEGLTAMVQGTYLADTALDLDGDAANGVDTYVNTIYAAASRYGVSPYVVASILLQEQGRSGASDSISGANSRFPGYYNYFNIGAYKTADFTAVERGLWYASGGNSGATSYGRPWNTRIGALAGGVEFYAANYLNAGQTTLYLKRFNVQGENPCAHQYMTNAGGACAEGVTLAGAYTAEMRAAALTFSIPVYSGMPETASPLPEGGGSVNDKLAALSVTGYDLTPAFSRDVTDYTVVVPNSAASVTLDAAPCDALASVSGTGDRALAVGSNVLTVTVRAVNGSVMTYTLRISRQEAAGGGAAEPTAAPETTPAPAATVEPTPAPAASAPTRKRGDVSGDGNVQINDLILLRNHLLGTAVLTGDALAAADTDGDGKVQINDLIRIRNHLLGIAIIQ